MPTIFISYRRADTGDACGRLYDRLAAEFGGENIFKDVDSIPPGSDFEERLQDEVAECDVLLAVIGPAWLTARDEHGNRRLENKSDFVRVEIEAALQRSVPVVPLLVRGATVPAGEQLPSSLRQLSKQQAAVIHDDPHFHSSVDWVVKRLRELDGPAGGAGRGGPPEAAHETATTGEARPGERLRGRAAGQPAAEPDAGDRSAAGGPRRSGIFGSVGGVAATVALALALLVGLGWLGVWWFGAVSSEGPGSADVQPERWERNQIILGGEDYLEGTILLAMTAILIEEEDPSITARRKYRLPEYIHLSSLRAGDLDLYVEYTATMLAYEDFKVRPSTWSNEAFHTPEYINELFESNPKYRGLMMLPHFGFSNPFAMVMARRRAEELGLLEGDRPPSLSDLARVSKRLDAAEPRQRLVCTGMPNFRDRPDCLRGLKQEYEGLTLDFRPSLHNEVYQRLDSGEADVAAGYGTDPQLHHQDEKYVRLRDDRGFFACYYPAPVGKRAFFERFPKVVVALHRLDGALTERDMADLIAEATDLGLDKADLSKATVERELDAMARQFLIEKGLLSRSAPSQPGI